MSEDRHLSPSEFMQQEADSIDAAEEAALKAKQPAPLGTVLREDVCRYLPFPEGEGGPPEGWPREYVAVADFDRVLAQRDEALAALRELVRVDDEAARPSGKRRANFSEWESDVWLEARRILFALSNQEKP